MNEPGDVPRSRTAGAALDAFVERYFAAWQARMSSLPAQPFDAGWRSVCEVGDPDDRGAIRWRAVRRDTDLDFVGLENALGVTLHADIKQYYGGYWCGALQASSEEGGLTLIQLWNEQDVERLLANVIGHAMDKRSDKQPLTVFFATTDEAEFFLSVDNTSGKVVLEEPRRVPVREVAPSLSEFLERLSPVVDADADMRTTL